jgi:acyl-coenzyme A synthetase/AMP-(fatty) acid ligase
MQLNFYENIYTSLCRNPEQVYIVWPELAQPLLARQKRADAGHPEGAKRYSGKDILEGIADFRCLLEKRRVRKGEEVLLAIPVSFELICALLALMAHGAVPVLPPAGASPADMLRLLRKRPLKAMLSAKKLNLLASLLLKSLRIKPLALEEAVQMGRGWEPAVKVNEQQAALISHSSGSTGNAKAIFRSHGILLAQHQALKETFPPFAGQHDFPLFPNILLHSLSLGIRSILPALPGFDLLQIAPSRLLEQLEAEHIHTLTGNVFYFKKLLACLQEKNAVFQDVKALGIGGSPVPEPLLFGLKNYFPQATIYVIYGTTEAQFSAA